MMRPTAMRQTADDLRIPAQRCQPIGIIGPVEHGDKRGRTIGFPTANIRMTIDQGGIPDGVYAATVLLPDGRIWRSAVSVGRRPSFYLEGERLCEAHLLGYDGDLYGQLLCVTLVWSIRGQRRFEHVPDLVAQLENDVAQCRVLLESSDGIPR